MPDEPLALRIVQNIQAAVRGIRVSQGYHHTVGAVAVKLDPNHNVEALIGDEQLRPFFIIEMLPETFEYVPAGGVWVTMSGIVHGVHTSDVESDDDWMTTYYRLCADIERALTQDLTRGGLVPDTRIESTAFRARGGAEVWAQVPIVIRLRRQFGSPNG